MRMVASGCLWKVETSIWGSSAFPPWSTPRPQILTAITACRITESCETYAGLTHTSYNVKSDLKYWKELLVHCRYLHQWLCAGSKRFPLNVMNDVIINFCHILRTVNNQLTRQCGLLSHSMDLTHTLCPDWLLATSVTKVATLLPFARVCKVHIEDINCKASRIYLGTLLVSGWLERYSVSLKCQNLCSLKSATEKG